jgi:hypothetical protein
VLVLFLLLLLLVPWGVVVVVSSIYAGFVFGVCLVDGKRRAEREQ